MTAEDIILPDNQAASDQIREALDDFMEKAGFNIPGITKEIRGIIETVFLAGYCAGHNDLLDTVRGQQQVVDSLHEILK